MSLNFSFLAILSILCHLRSVENNVPFQRLDGPLTCFKNYKAIPPCANQALCSCDYGQTRNHFILFEKSCNWRQLDPRGSHWADQMPQARPWRAPQHVCTLVCVWGHGSRWLTWPCQQLGRLGSRDNYWTDQVSLAGYWRDLHCTDFPLRDLQPDQWEQLGFPAAAF